MSNDDHVDLNFSSNVTPTLKEELCFDGWIFNISEGKTVVTQVLTVRG